MGRHGALGNVNRAVLNVNPRATGTSAAGRAAQRPQLGGPSIGLSLAWRCDACATFTRSFDLLNAPVLRGWLGVTGTDQARAW